MAYGFGDLGYWPAILFLVVFLSSGYLIWRQGAKADRDREQRFNKREEITLEEFLRSCDVGESVNPTIVAEFLSELAHAIGTTPGKLRPNDRIDQELAPVKGWEYGDNVLLMLDRFIGAKLQGKQATFPRLETVKDFIQTLCT